MTSSPRKVLHILSGATGGAALSSLGIIRAMGIPSCVVCHDMGDDLKPAIREATHGEALFTELYWQNRKIRSKWWKRPVHEALQIARTGWARGSALRVAAFARRHGVDLIHTGTILTPEGGIAARWLGLPNVQHVRELVGPGNPFVIPHLARFLRTHASVVVANSHATAAQLPGRVEVIPNGIDVKRFTPGPSSRERPVVAMVGSLASRSKKHALFIDAARNERAEFRIYGEVPDDDYVRTLRARAAGRVTFMGLVNDPVEIMKAIDVLVMPADKESFGRVVVEAMAARLPVVGVRGGGVGEIVVDEVTGLVAPPDSSDAIAERIDRLIADPSLRQRLGDAGRARAEKEYSLDATAARMLAVYEAAMRKPL